MDVILKAGTWQFVSAGLFLAAGAMLFIMFYSRVLLGLGANPWKCPLTAVTFLLLAVVIPGWAFVEGPSLSLIAPAAVILLTAAGELHRLRVRREHEADSPVECKSTALPLWKPFTTCDLAMRRYETRLPQRAAPRLRLALISDLHIDNMLSDGYFRSVINSVSGYHPDIAVIAGDFVSRKKYAPRIPDVLRGLKARFGVFAVLGNHDHWSDAEAVSRYAKEAGVHLLTNSHERIRLNESAAIILSGCEDPWGPGSWSMPDHAADEPVLVITHTADNIYKLSKAGAAAVFAGHYHAGQAVLPWFGSIVVPSKYGRRYDHGHFLVNNTHLFVTAGIGTIFPPFRIYCKPEIMLIDFSGS